MQGDGPMEEADFREMQEAEADAEGRAQEQDFNNKHKKMSKTYINGTMIKEVQGQYGSFLNMSVNIDKLKEHANEKGYVNMTISKRKEPGQYGDTHYATLNEWKPKEVKQESGQEVSIEDLPF